MEASLKKVIFTCGGTAGHVNPAIALAQLMREKDPETEFLFVGAERGLEKDLIPKAGYDFRTVHISSFHRSFKPREIQAQPGLCGEPPSGARRGPGHSAAVPAGRGHRNGGIRQLPYGEGRCQGGDPHGRSRVQHGAWPHHGDAGALRGPDHGGV